MQNIPVEIQEQMTSLDRIGDGAALQLFELELQRVLKNLMDVNTDPKVKRSITLKFNFTTNDARNHAQVEIVAGAPKLAPVKPLETSLLIGAIGDIAIASERAIVQPTLFPVTEGTKENV